MAIAVVSDNRVGAMLAAPPGVLSRSDQQWTQAIIQYQKDKEAALQIISSLNGRVRELESNLQAEKQVRHQDAQQYEDQLFQGAQQREQLAKQLEETQQRFQQLTVLADQRIRQIQELGEQQEQNVQLIEALRQEVQALAQQVTQEKEQVRLLSDQFKTLLKQNKALLLQMNQMADQINQQQRQILVNQEAERRRAEQQPARQGALDELICAVKKYIIWGPFRLLSLPPDQP